MIVMRRLSIWLITLFLLVSCGSSSTKDRGTNSSIINVYPNTPYEILTYNIEKYEIIISSIENISFTSQDIVDIKVHSFEIIEAADLENINEDEVATDDRSKRQEILKNLAIGTSFYLVAFTIRSATKTPVAAMVAFATDVAIGIVVDFLIDVLPKMLESTEKNEEFKALDALLFLSRGYRLGSYFDVTFALTGLAFGGTFNKLMARRASLKILSRSIGAPTKITKEALDTLSKKSGEIFKSLDNVVGNDLKKLTDIIDANIDKIDASSEVKKVLKDAIKNNSNELRKIVSDFDPKVVKDFQNYVDAYNYRELISGIRVEVLPETHRLRNLGTVEIKNLILNSRSPNSIKYLNENGISHERVLKYLRESIVDPDEVPSLVIRAFDYFLNDLKNLPLGDTTYKKAIQNESILRNLSIKNLERVNVIKSFDELLSPAQLEILEKYTNAVALRSKGVFKEYTPVNEIVDGIERLVKNGDTKVLSLARNTATKKIIINSVENRISHSLYKKISEELFSDYLVQQLNLNRTLADQISKARNIGQVESLINKIDNLSLREEVLSSFGFIKKSNNEFYLIVSRQIDEPTAKIIVDNYPDVEKTRSILNQLLVEGKGNKNNLTSTIKNIEEIYKYKNEKVDGVILDLLVQPKVVKYYSNMVFQIDHSRVMKLLYSKFNSSDVALFEDLIRKGSKDFLNVNFSNQNIQRIALQYIREINVASLDSLSIKNINIIIFSKYSRQSDPRLILRDSEKLYEIFSVPRTPAEIDSLISSFDTNLRNSITDIYQNGILRQSELILELNNKKLLSLNQDFVVKVVKDDLIRLSKQSTDEQIRIAATKMIENDVIEKIVAGEFENLSNDIAETVLYKYDSILPLVKTLPDTTQNTFFDSIARIRGKKSVDRLLVEKQKFLSKLSAEGISSSARIEYENAIKLIDDHLKRDFLPARDNQSFLKFVSNYGLDYDQGIERFYTVVEFELDGQIIRKHFAKLDAFADLAVTSVELTGDNAADFLLVRRMINMADDPFTLTQHHLEDGLNILFVSTEVHKALYHEGGASLLRLLEDLKRVENLV
jgi:hypothetical protein